MEFRELNEFREIREIRFNLKIFTFPKFTKFLSTATTVR